MLEWLGSGILGSLFGGVFRLAPEIIKFFDRKDERRIELEMLKVQVDLEKTKGELKVEEKYVDFSTTQLDTLAQAYRSQAEEAKSSYKWVSALSALVRPVVTYFIFGLYACFKITMMIYALQSGIPWVDVMQMHWTVDDFAMLNMILTFWFVGRSIEKYRR